MTLQRPLLLLAVLLVALSAAACGRSAALSHNAGNDDFDGGDYAAALQAYEGAGEQSPESPEPFYNSGNAYYRQDQYEEAQKQFREALLNADQHLTEQTMFNLGNAFLKSDQVEAAIDSYKEALRIDPDDRDAKHNLELALRLLEEQDQQGQQQPEDEPQQGPEQAEQQEEQSEQDQQQAEQQPQPAAEAEQPQEVPLTEEQARQLLESLAKDAETLQERLQRVYIVPGSPPEQDW